MIIRRTVVLDRTDRASTTDAGKCAVFRKQLSRRKRQERIIDQQESYERQEDPYDEIGDVETELNYNN